jgi:alkylated DNA repair dioxygenase AlkB
VHYGADYNRDRGKHIDNRSNGGDIIVGVTLGNAPLDICRRSTDGHRKIELSMGSFSRKYVLPPASVYMMKGQCRYEYHHDATKPVGTTHNVIMMRFGKAI